MFKDSEKSTQVCKKMNPNRTFTILDQGMDGGERFLYTIQSSIPIRKNTYSEINQQRKNFQKTKFKDTYPVAKDQESGCTKKFTNQQTEFSSK